MGFSTLVLADELLCPTRIFGRDIMLTRHKINSQCVWSVSKSGSCFVKPDVCCEMDFLFTRNLLHVNKILLIE